MYQLKAKDSEIKTYPLFPGNFSKDFTIDNMKEKKTELNRYVYDFHVDYYIIDPNKILDINFAEYLASNSEISIKYLYNQPCQARSKFFDINSNKTFFIHITPVLISLGKMQHY